MVFFLYFMFACILLGAGLRKQRMRTRGVLLLGLSFVAAIGYFFFNQI